jgi:Flp pilus assembly pilin Flp
MPFDYPQRTLLRRRVAGIAYKLRRPVFADSEGQTMVEYAVVLGVITVAIIGTFASLSGTISSAVSTVAGLV